MHERVFHDRLFPMFGFWEPAFRTLTDSLKQMLRARVLRPREVAALAKLIYALERLPSPTSDVAIEASMTSHGKYGRGSLTLQHYGDYIELSYVEAFYQPQGIEHSIRSVLEAEVGVGNNREHEDPITVAIELDDWVSEWSNRALDPDCKFEIYDDNDPMDWDQPTHEQGWGALPICS